MILQPYRCRMRVTNALRVAGRTEIVILKSSRQKENNAVLREAFTKSDVFSNQLKKVQIKKIQGYLCVRKTCGKFMEIYWIKDEPCDV